MIIMYIFLLEWTTQDERGRVRHQMFFTTPSGAEKWASENIKGNLSMTINKAKLHGSFNPFSDDTSR